MKPHSQEFKEQITQMGRQLRGIITYENITLEEEIMSITPHYEANLLKSVMKQLDLELTVDIPLETVINCQIGILVNGNYEMLNFGNYVVYKSEKQEDTNTYKLTCYDKMLYAMKENEDLGVTYPISISAYLVALANKIGLSVETQTFYNSSLTIPSELYLGQNYTYRDILDEIAQATGSVICINDNDNLEVRYPNDLGAEVTATGKDITITEHEDNKISAFKIYGSSEQETTEGYNLLGLVDGTYYPSGSTYGASITFKDGVGKINVGQQAGSFGIKIPLITPVTLKANQSYTRANNSGKAYPYITLFDSEDKSMDTMAISDNGLKVYTPTENKEVTAIYLWFSIQSYEDIKPMMVEGSYTASTMPAFEKFTYGASPNPNYEQPIKSCGDNVNEFDKDNAIILNAIPDTSSVISSNTAKSFYIPIKPNTTYTISREIVGARFVAGTTGSLPSIGVPIIDRIVNNNGSTITITSSNNAKYLMIYYLYNTSENEEEILSSIKIEKGDKATPYSPYGMGCVNEKVQNKNYLNLKDGTYTNNGIMAVVKDGEVVLNGTAENRSFLAIPISNINFDGSEKYTLSANNTEKVGTIDGDPYACIRFMGMGDRAQIVRLAKENNSVTYAWNSTVSDLTLRTEKGLTYNNFIIKPQLEKGEKASEFIAHQEQNISIPTQQPMRSIGDIRDLFFKNTVDSPYYDSTLALNGWYERHYSTEIVAPSSKWQLESSGRFLITKSNLGISLKTPLTDDSILKNKCTHYIEETAKRTWKKNQGFSIDGAGNINIYDTTYSSNNDLDGFQNFLSNNDVRIVALLENPTDLPCTSEQIEALNSLSYMTLYDGITYINSDANIEFRYVAEYETIDEEFLKDVNINFSKMYGPVNSIVLSRAAESDNVYLRNERSVQEDGLCEIKIVDNQIMNFNNRSDFLQGILDALGGLEYYINDFNSPGILYLSLLDRYSIQIGENKYKSIMLNDEVNVTTGIEEIVYTDMPEQSETDYEKADKTDRKINQTYIIVDKQNQTIKSVVKNVTAQNNKISQITQTVGELNSKIQDIADITTYGESDRAYVELTGINQSEPIMIKAHPTTTNISYLYPRANLYPDNTLYITTRTIRFIRTYEEDGTTKTENIDYELPDDLLRYSSEVYDEFYLDYDSQTCQVIKRCGYNADGTVYQLANEITTNYPYPQILLGDGDYSISLKGYDYGYIYVRLMAQNIYTTQFATKAEVTSEINQSAQAIDLSVNKKLTNYSTTTEMNSAITVKANEINSTVSQKVGKNEVISSINQSSEAVSINANKINLNGAVTANQNFKIKTDGSMEAKNGTFTGGNISLSGGTIENPRLQVVSSSSSSTKASIAPDAIRVGSGSVYLSFASGILNIRNNNSSFQMLASSSRINASVDDFYVIGTMHANAYNYDSLQSIKKNIKKYDKNVLDIIKEGKIYEFNFKTEDDKTSKHIGFIIPDEGGDFYTPNEVIAKDGKGIDAYNMASILWKAVQEQQEQIEKMEKEIEELKGGRE